MNDLGPLRVEITAPPRRPTSLMLTVAGYLLPVTAGTLTFNADELPELNVSLPVIDGLVVSLDASVKVSEQTWAALVAMGWTPPGEEVLPAPSFIGKAGDDG